MGFHGLSRLFFGLALPLVSLSALHSQDRGSNTASLKVSGSKIDVTLPDGQMKLSRQDLLGTLDDPALTAADSWIAGQLNGS